MDNLIKGERYFVDTGTSKGLNLRREPTTKATTKDGQKNIIVSIPNDTLVMLESDIAQESDGYTWYNIRRTHEDIEVDDEIGWVARDYLRKPPPGWTWASLPPLYTFIFNNTSYVTTSKNFKSAKEAKLIFKSAQGDSVKITVKSKEDKGKSYTKDHYTTATNVQTMMQSKAIWT